MAPHSSTLAWKIPWTEKPGRLQSMGSGSIRHNWATSLSLFTFMLWRRKWQPTPVFLPGESQRRGSLVGCHLWGHRVGHDWFDLAAASAAVFSHAAISITSEPFHHASKKLPPSNSIPTVVKPSPMPSCCLGGFSESGRTLWILYHWAAWESQSHRHLLIDSPPSPSQHCFYWNVI